MITGRSSGLAQVGKRNPRAHLVQDPKPDIVAEIPLNFYNLTIVALIDTGCSTCCTAERQIQCSPIFQDFLYCPQTDIGHSINGSDVVTVGLIQLLFHIGPVPFKVNSRVMRGLVRPVVIGWDFLCKNRAIINLEDKTLTICGVTVPFLERQRYTIPPHLSAFESTVIPPFTRMPVKATIHSDLGYIESAATSFILSQPAIK